MDKRTNILETVRAYPGLHLRALARIADTSLQLLQYHLQHLADAELVLLDLDGGKLRAFPPGLSVVQRRILGALREPKRAGIIEKLTDRPLSHGALAKALRMGKSTLSFHLSYLADVGVVVRDGEVRLADKATVLDLMAHHAPAPDSAAALGNLWARLYGED
jgi:predicted transcriptional regulator